MSAPRIFQALANQAKVQLPEDSGAPEVPHESRSESGSFSRRVQERYNAQQQQQQQYERPASQPRPMKPSPNAYEYSHPAPSSAQALPEEPVYEMPPMDVPAEPEMPQQPPDFVPPAPPVQAPPEQAPVPDYTIPPAMPTNLSMAYDANEERIEKQACLVELYKLSRLGVRLTRDFNMNDSLFEMKLELSKQQDTQAMLDSVAAMRDHIAMGVQFIDLGNTMFGPVLALDGWAESVTSDMDKFNRPLQSLYYKYMRKKDPNPILQLGLLLGGTMIATHFKNKLMSSAGGGGHSSENGPNVRGPEPEPTRPRDPPRQAEQPQQTYHEPYRAPQTPMNPDMYSQPPPVTLAAADAAGTPLRRPAPRPQPAMHPQQSVRRSLKKPSTVMPAPVRPPPIRRDPEPEPEPEENAGAFDDYNEEYNEDYNNNQDGFGPPKDEPPTPKRDNYDYGDADDLMDRAADAMSVNLN